MALADALAVLDGYRRDLCDLCAEMGAGAVKVYASVEDGAPRYDVVGYAANGERAFSFARETEEGEDSYGQ